MIREDIYDHLAQVYLGKRKQVSAKKKKQYNAWLFINIGITAIIFASSFYGLTAFLRTHDDLLKSKVIYSLHKGPIRIDYDFSSQYPPTKTFALSLSEVDVDKYAKIQFSIRHKDTLVPGNVKIVLTNARNESSSYYIENVGAKWQDVAIPLNAFERISDWSSLKDISFTIESWNMNDKRGEVLIDQVRFSS